MLDLIAQLQIPVIIVARSSLGTLNHTLLTLQALRLYSIPILGVIVNGKQNTDNMQAIQHYGQVDILASMPRIEKLSPASLSSIPLTTKLYKIFFKEVQHDEIKERYMASI